MAIRKGDLVVFDKNIPGSLDIPVEFGNAIAMVVVKGPYEGEFLHPTKRRDKNQSELVMAVDVLYGGDILKKVPLKYLTKIINSVNLSEGV